jgi:hypothetical protein
LEKKKGYSLGVKIQANSLLRGSCEKIQPGEEKADPVVRGRGLKI